MLTGFWLPLAPKEIPAFYVDTDFPWMSRSTPYITALDEGPVVGPPPCEGLSFVWPPTALLLLMLLNSIFPFACLYI